jgi:hypothetical protein
MGLTRLRQEQMSQFLAASDSLPQLSKSALPANDLAQINIKVKVFLRPTVLRPVYL